MADLRIDGRMKVKTLKANFKKHLAQHCACIQHLIVSKKLTTRQLSPLLWARQKAESVPSALTFALATSRRK